MEAGCGFTQLWWNGELGSGSSDGVKECFCLFFYTGVAHHLINLFSCAGRKAAVLCSPTTQVRQRTQPVCQQQRTDYLLLQAECVVTIQKGVTYNSPFIFVDVCMVEEKIVCAEEARSSKP